MPGYGEGGEIDGGEEEGHPEVAGGEGDLEEAGGYAGKQAGQAGGVGQAGQADNYERRLSLELA